MKKFLNEPANAVDEMLDGFCRAHADRVFRFAPRVVGSRARRDGVGLITGGGSGHKPAFIGYLGAGMLGTRSRSETSLHLRRPTRSGSPYVPRTRATESSAY